MAQNVSSLPDPSQYAWKKVISGIKRPLFITGSEDGSGRLFIVLQTGLIMIAKEGQLLEQPFLDIQSLTNGPRTDTEYSELGLLGLAFDPDFVQNGFFYVNYTNPDGFSVLARYTVSSQNPDQAESSSAVILLTQKQPYPNHNGGMLAFGPDGMLYMGLGDGGAAGDPQGNGQNLQTLLGKILRIDVHNGQPYRIPADNPFFNSGGLPEIWAFGLRNPWRFSFDRLTGDFYIADVGQKRWEEINFVPVGSPGGINFGWDFREGAHPYEGEPPADLVFQDPITEYSHSEGCSVSGGVVVRDPNLIEWQGVYLYGDFCSGRVWGLLQVDQGRWLNAELFQTGLNISSFGEDDQGRIYLADHAGGDIYRLERK
jgi:glucose/arabinose dehydrogenase